MSDMKDNEPQLGDPGEHPLSILLFSWMRGKMFLRVFAILLGLIGVGAIGLEILFLAKPIKDVTTVPGFYAAFGFLAFAIAVLSGWPLGKLLRRREDYYETRSGEAGRDR
jgi:hypothetical protein